MEFRCNFTILKLYPNILWIFLIHTIIMLRFFLLHGHFEIMKEYRPRFIFIRKFLITGSIKKLIIPEKTESKKKIMSKINITIVLINKRSFWRNSPLLVPLEEEFVSFSDTSNAHTIKGVHSLSVKFLTRSSGTRKELVSSSEGLLVSRVRNRGSPRRTQPH